MNEPLKDTAAWRFQVWASFALSTVPTLVGVFYLPIDPWMRAFLTMGLIFTIGSCFTLAKTLRDQHESQKLLNRLADAKAEQVIREYELGQRAAA
jgi:hypothetical protein